LIPLLLLWNLPRRRMAEIRMLLPVARVKAVGQAPPLRSGKDALRNTASKVAAAAVVVAAAGAAAASCLAMILP